MPLTSFFKFISGPPDAVALSWMRSLEYGSSSNTAFNLIHNGAQRVFNQSKYFARNETGVKSATWYAGSVKLNSETPLQMYNSMLKAFNMKNDLLGGTSPFIRHYGDFIETCFAHVISFQARMCALSLSGSMYLAIYAYMQTLRYMQSASMHIHPTHVGHSYTR